MFIQKIIAGSLLALIAMCGVGKWCEANAEDLNRTINKPISVTIREEANRHR